MGGGKIVADKTDDFPNRIQRISISSYLLFVVLREDCLDHLDKANDKALCLKR
mgnify:CR=1 FL=1